MLRSGSLGPGKRYTVVSLVSRATPDQLKRAGALSTYPREVVSRYTALPEMPYRVEALTLDLTRNQSTVYDKARAVEAYLRTFHYTTDVVPPPTDRDAVDYFLFEMKEGYCDYFASAMSVMLRSIGIPARVASGYASGDRATPSDPFTIRDSNAHSWVEVYFPRYGWIEFDPTPGGAAYAVAVNSGEADPALGPEQLTPEPESPPAGEQAPEDPGAAADPSATGGESSPLNPTTLRAAALALLALALLGGALAVLWYSGFAGLPPPAAAYARTTQLASILGWRPRPSETPREYTSRLGQAAPAVGPSLGLIADSFIALRYGRQRAQPSAVMLDAAWLKVREGLAREAVRGVTRRLQLARRRAR
jgi:hypothetical protein